MSNPLIQQLCSHISKLQTENEQLKNTLHKYHTLFHEICRVSGCETWTGFLGWLFDYFRDTGIKNQSEGKAGPAECLGKELKGYGGLDQIQEEIEKISEISSIAGRSVQQIVAEAQLPLQKLVIPKIQNNLSVFPNSDMSLSDIDYIIIENTQLRRQNYKLADEMQKIKESLQSMVYVLKANESGGLTQITNSTDTSIISMY